MRCSIANSGEVYEECELSDAKILISAMRSAFPGETDAQIRERLLSDTWVENLAMALLLTGDGMPLNSMVSNLRDIFGHDSESGKLLIGKLLSAIVRRANNSVKEIERIWEGA